MNDMKICYAGIGSRSITKKEEEIIQILAQQMNRYNFYLYSGHAEGSDQVFENATPSDHSVIFLPWDRFNYPFHAKYVYIKGDDPIGIDSVYRYHPAPDKLKRGGLACMSRNYFQIHGDESLGWPRVKFVISCTDEKNGVYSGGTAQAIRIAKSLDIPVFNIRSKKWESELNQFISALLSDFFEMK